MANWDKRCDRQKFFVNLSLNPHAGILGAGQDRLLGCAISMSCLKRNEKPLRP